VIEAIDYTSGITSAWTRVATFVPKFVAFLIILIIGYLVAKVLAKVLMKVLQRVGFDRLVERGGVKKALAHSQYDAASLLSRLVFYAVMLFVLSTAFGVFGSNPVSAYLKAVVAYLPLVFVAIIIVVVAAAIAAAVKGLIQNSLGELSYARLLANCASAFILALGVIAALDQLHIAAAIVNAVLYAALAAIVGVIIVAVGGGGIRTMSGRWEAAAARYDSEKPRITQAVRNAPSISQQAGQAARQYAASDSTGGATAVSAADSSGRHSYDPLDPGSGPIR
jgi:Conserved TM helix